MWARRGEGRGAVRVRPNRPALGGATWGGGAFRASSACCFEGRGSLQRLSFSHPSVFVFSVATFHPDPYYFCGYVGGKSRSSLPWGMLARCDFKLEAFPTPSR